MRLFVMLFLTSLFGAAPRADATDGVRASITATSRYIFDECDTWKSLAAQGVRASVLQAKIKQVGTTDHIRIVDEVTLADARPRSAVNDPTTGDITFSRLMWRKAQSDPVARVGIVLHEYLGLMKIEKTDDYHISEKVMRELRVRALLNGPDAAFLNPPIPSTQSPSDPSCPDFSGIWFLVSNPKIPIHWGLSISQKGCESIRMRTLDFDVRGRYRRSQNEDIDIVSRIQGRHARLGGGAFGFKVGSSLNDFFEYEAVYKDQKLVITENAPGEEAGHSTRYRGVWRKTDRDHLVLQEAFIYPSGRVSSDESLFVRVKP